MNFLAHLYLSDDNEKIAVGNFIADFVKGSMIDEFDSEIQKGIVLHREIDRYTDSHELVKNSKTRLWDTYRHYSAVIVDIYYDHFLASNWRQFSEEPLKAYTTRQYDMLSRYAADFPDRAQKTLFHMSKTDWLFNYRYLEGIDMALKGMSRRATFRSGMDRAIRSLEEEYDAFQAEFDAFFPQLIHHMKEYSRDFL